MNIQKIWQIQIEPMIQVKSSENKKKKTMMKTEYLTDKVKQNEAILMNIDG